MAEKYYLVQNNKQSIVIAGRENVKRFLGCNDLTFSNMLNEGEMFKGYIIDISFVRKETYPALIDAFILFDKGRRPDYVASFCQITRAKANMFFRLWCDVR